MATDVDILVCGGGPAGLLAASYLGASHSVALIERARLGRTTKFWVSTERRLGKHSLSHCVANRPPAMLVGTFLGGRIVMHGDMVVVDEDKFLSELIARCASRGVHLSEQASLLNLSWTASRVIAQTTKGTYRARIAVDATGTGSPIAETFRLHRLDGFLSVFGTHFRNIDLRTSDMVLAYANALGNPPPMLEVIPTGSDSAHCTVFVYARRLTSPASLDTIFRQQCAHNPFFKLTVDSQRGHVKLGAIAIGKTRRRQLPGVISIGEAGMVQPPLLGSAFNEVLEYCEQTCRHISVLLANTTGLVDAPNYRFPLMKRVQDRMQLALARMLLSGNVETFDRLLRFLDTLNPGVVYDFCSNQLTCTELLNASLRLPRYFLTASRRLTIRDDS